MRVLIDARSIEPKLSGVGRHALNLLLGLSHINSDLEFLVLYSSPRAPKVIDRAGGIYRNRFQWIRSSVTHNSTMSFIKKNFEIPFILKTHRADLFHDVGGVDAKTLNVPVVRTIHELEGLHGDHKSAYREAVKRKLKGSRLIITVSKTLAQEIDSELHFSMPQIRVIRNGIDPWYFENPSQEEVRAMRERFQIHNKYFLCVTSQRRASKNYSFAIDFARQSNRNEDWVFTLPDKLEPKKTSTSEGSFHFLDILDDIWLRPLYAESAGVIVPSTYEGFSLPPIEALACGAIPIVSKIGPHEETLGGILPPELFFDPKNLGSLKKAIEYTQEGGDPMRLGILEKFKLAKEQFSFIEMSKKVHAVYHEALRK